MILKAIINKILKRKHFHYYSKPILSKYWTFNSRKIIYECRCGDRIIKTVWKSFGESFPIKTTNFLSNKEFESAIDKTLKQ